MPRAYGKAASGGYGKQAAKAIAYFVATFPEQAPPHAGHEMRHDAPSIRITCAAVACVEYLEDDLIRNALPETLDRIGIAHDPAEMPALRHRVTPMQAQGHDQLFEQDRIDEGVLTIGGCFESNAHVRTGEALDHRLHLIDLCAQVDRLCTDRFARRESLDARSQFAAMATGTLDLSRVLRRLGRSGLELHELRKADDGAEHVAEITEHDVAHGAERHHATAAT